MNKAQIKKSIKLANANFSRSRFTVAEFQQIADHVLNSDFIERGFLHKCVPALTFDDVQALVDNQLKMQMDTTPCSTLLHEILGGYKGTGIDVTSYSVAIWGPEHLKKF